MTVVDATVEYITRTTAYTPYQVYRVFELIGKYGDKVRSHLTKKQNKILDLILYIYQLPEKAKE